MRPLVRAFLISLILHILLFTTIEVGNRLELSQFGPFKRLAQALGLDRVFPLPTQPDATRTNTLDSAQREVEEEIPILFVDVDPSQATTEVPEKTEYYSAVSSLAANRDTSRDTGVPKIDGTQDKVLKTMDTDRAEIPEPLQSAPVAPQQPQEGVSPEVVPPQPVAAVPVPPTPEPIPAPASPLEPEAGPGETLLAKANPASVPATVQIPAPVAPVPVARQRPRTVAAALAQRQINPNSALIGDKMKQDGGVARFSVSSSLDVQATPLGSYDAKFIAAVQQCWYSLLEDQRYSLDRMGKVVIDFRLTADGRISDLKTAQTDVGEIYTTLCELAIHRPAPYEKWPADVRRMVGDNYRDVRFTFYY